MFRKLITLLLVALLVNLGGVRLVYANSKEEKQAVFAEKIKANVLKLGVGESARVKIKLRDKTKLEGYFPMPDRKLLPSRTARQKLRLRWPIRK